MTPEFHAHQRIDAATWPTTTRERVLAALGDGPKTAPALLAALGDGYDSHVVRYHLRRLVTQGLLVVERRARRYRGDALTQYRLAVSNQLSAFRSRKLTTDG